MTATIYITLTHDEVQATIPYAMICETREGSRWAGRKLKERWREEFTPQEREAASRLFSQAHDWYLKKGVPEEVTMTGRTLALWHKLAAFCASL